MTEEGKLKAGPFSEKGKWGKSSISYSVSIKELFPDAWAEIKAGALKFVKYGNQPLPKRDPRALIINHYDDINDIEIIEQQPASSKEISIPVSVTHHIPDIIHNALESQSDLLNSPLCPDLATDMFITEDPSNSQPIAVMDTHCPSQPPLSISSPFMQEDLMSQNIPASSGSGLQSWVNPHSDDAGAVHQNISSTGMFMRNGGFVEGHAFTMPSGLRRGNTFLTGPLVTFDNEGEH